MHRLIDLSKFTCLLCASTVIFSCSGGQEAYEIPDSGPVLRVDSGHNDALVINNDAAASVDSLDPSCDVDTDGYRSIACGGDDCDDTAFNAHPGAPELCSFIDENCDGDNNEELDCTFIAAGEDKLYKIDPFAGTINLWRTVQLPDSHGLLDIDTNPAGQLLAATDNGLYIINEDGQMQELPQVDVPVRTNGMAINSHGRIFLTNKPYAGDGEAGAFGVDPLTGNIDRIGNLAPYESSGDCVMLKDDSLLMTAPDPDTDFDPEHPYARHDLLVYIDSNTAQTRLIGSTNFAKIYGLSASFDFLFGVTDNGKVLQIDSHTGAATELFSDPSIRFWGAANGD